MNKRFPNYQPSTALRRAIAALNRAKSSRATATAVGTTARVPGPVQGGAPDAKLATPGREDTDTGRNEGQEDPGADALASRRIDDGK